MTTTLRCENCGCGLEEGAGVCPACGVVRVGASVGAVGAQSYDMRPLPAGPYDVELGVSETLSWTFKMWAENLPRLAALGVVPYVFMLPFIAFSGLALIRPEAIGGMGDVFHGDNWLWLVPVGVALCVLIFVGSLAAAAGIIHLVDEKQRGVVVGPVSALLSGLRHVGWLFLGWVLMAALMAFGMLGPTAPIAVAISENQPVYALLALPGLVTTGIAFVIGARLAPTLPAIVVEDIGLGAALERSWSLTRGKTGVVVGASLLFMLAYMGVSLVAGMVGIVPVLGAIAQIAINAMLLPLAYLFPYALYAGCVREEQRTDRA